MRFYQVGKKGKTGRLAKAFKIARTDRGGVRLIEIQESVSALDRQIVLAHFGLELKATTGAGGSLYRRSFTPGTADHFTYAVHLLPAPFGLMRRNA